MAQPPQFIQDAAHEAQRLRGWVSNAYAQVEYVLGDILMRAKDMPEYEGVVGRLPHGAPKRVKKVKALLEKEGFFTQHSVRLEALVAAFEEYHEIRNLLAHGFCTIYHTPDRDVGFEFRKWHRSEDDEDTEIREMFRIIDLRYHEAQLTPLAEEATALLREIHVALGIAGV